MRNQVLVVGASGHGKVVANISMLISAWGYAT